MGKINIYQPNIDNTFGEDKTNGVDLHGFCIDFLPHKTHAVATFYFIKWDRKLLMILNQPLLSRD